MSFLGTKLVFFQETTILGAPYLKTSPYLELVPKGILKEMLHGFPEFSLKTRAVLSWSWQA